MTFVGVLTVIFLLILAGAIVWFVDGLKINEVFKRSVYLVLFIAALYWIWGILAHGESYLLK